MINKLLKLPMLLNALIVFIFIWGILLRAPELISGNFIWGHDHGRDYLMAREMIEQHKFRLIGNEVGSGSAGLNGIFHGPGYHYILALSYLLFRGDPYGGMVAMFVFGIFTMSAAYFLTRKILGKQMALFTLFFTSVSALIVSQSRFIWSSHPITPFIFLALYFLFRIPDNPKIYIPLAVFMSGFTYESQLGVAVPLFLMIIVSILAVYRKINLKIAFYSIIATLLAFLPMILFEIRHDFMMVRGLLNYIQSGPGGEGFNLISRLSMHLPFYWYNFINTFTFEFGVFSTRMQTLSVLAVLPFIILGLSKAPKGKERNFIISLIIIVIGTFILYIPLNNIVWDYYLTHLRVVYIVLFSYGIVRFLRMEKSWFRNTGFMIIGVFLIVLISGSFYRMKITYTQDVSDYGANHKIRGKRDAIDWIYKDANGNPFSLFIYVPYIYTYPYDYLLETYAVNKYGYLPGKDKKGIAYILIDSDDNQPIRVKGWLETVVGGGKNLTSVVLESGIIIEKKIYD